MSDRRFLAVNLLALCLVYLGVWSVSGVLGKGSGLEMSDIAERLVRGFGFSSPYLAVDSGVPTAVSPPLYVGIVALFYELFGVKSTWSRIFLQCLNIVFHAVALVLLYQWITKVLNRSVARIFAVIFVFSPHVVFLASNVWESSLSLMLLSLVLYCVAFRFPVWSAPGYLAFGCLLGLVALSNPAWTLAFPFVCVGACLQHFSDQFWRRFLVSGTLIVMGYAVVVAPWMVRNYQVTGELMYVRNMAGPEWFKGNNIRAGGGHGQGFVDYFIYTSEAERVRYAQMGESDYDKMMLAAALDDIRSDPIRYAELTVRRVAMWWSGDVDVARWYFRNGHIKEFYMSLIMTLVGSGVSVLAFWGAWKLRHQFRTQWLLFVYVFVLPVPYYFIIVGFRYQSSLLPFALVMAAYAIYQWTPYLRHLAKRPR